MSQKSTILIVDDEPIGRQLIDAILYKEGYNLEFAENGKEAFEKAKSLNPDLILMDVMMPEIDGFEVCQMLRSDQEMVNVPIILVTALDDIDSRIRGLEAGADDYISKPFDRLELLARIKIITRLNRYRKSGEDQSEVSQSPVNLSASVSTDLLNSLVNEINKINSNISEIFNNSFINTAYDKNIKNIDLYGADKIIDKSHFYLCGSQIDTNESIVSLYISNILAKSKPGKIVSDFKNALRALKTSMFSGSNTIKPYCTIIEIDETTHEVSVTGINNSVFILQDSNVNILTGNSLDLAKNQETANVETKKIPYKTGDILISVSGLLLKEGNNSDALIGYIKESSNNIDDMKNNLIKFFEENQDLEKSIGNIIFTAISI